MRHAAPNRGAKLRYGTGHRLRWLRSKNVPVSSLKKYVEGEAAGEGFNSHRSPGIITRRHDTCQVSCAHGESSVTSVSALTAGELPSQRFRLSVSALISSAMALSTPVASRQIGTM